MRMGQGRCWVCMEGVTDHTAPHFAPQGASRSWGVAEVFCPRSAIPSLRLVCQYQTRPPGQQQKLGTRQPAPPGNQTDAPTFFLGGELKVFIRIAGPFWTYRGVGNLAADYVTI